MILDLKKPYERQKFRLILRNIYRKKAVVEIKEIHEKRSLNQNSYFHVLCTIFALDQWGGGLDYAKDHFKINCPIHFVSIGGKLAYFDEENFTHYRRTSKLNTKEMSVLTNWIRNYAAKHGCYLPTPDEYRSKWWEYVQEIEKNREYL